MTWLDAARECIRKVHAGLPETATFEERKAALRAAYPFGEREMHPYKMWCKAQREYLRSYHKSVDSVPEGYLSPMERMMKRAKERAGQ
jgi:hypothetical protein